MKLPQYLTTVTPLSKFLALFLFFTLPLIGFYLGMEYQKTIVDSLSEVTPIYSQKTGSSSENKLIDNEKLDVWKEFKTTDFVFTYPFNWIATSDVLPTTLKDDSGNPVVSIGLFDPALVGITFCGANPDNQRCEGPIDWMDNSEAVATLIKNKVGITITLHLVTEKNKEIFRHIISSFQFLDNIKGPTITRDSLQFPNNINDCRSLKKQPGISIYEYGCSYTVYAGDANYSLCIDRGGEKVTAYADGMTDDSNPLSAEINYCIMKFSLK